mmetsp:Transcript_1318/g.2382  ORF Transcript_1318/g.2382 Transcript_1318/m.2382 type:complete len:264 (-) Transcript_1318:33-824(-)
MSTKTKEDEAYVEAMAKEHADDKPTETPASQVQPEVPVVDESVKLKGEQSAYWAVPEQSSNNKIKASIVVIHEWWGLNDQIKSVTRQLAGQGYAALAVNLYGCDAVSSPHEAMKIMDEALEHKEKLVENLKDAVAFLNEKNAETKLGVIGWCFGGAWALQTSLVEPMDATVIYYGHLHYNLEKLKTLKGPVLGIFGEKDNGIPVEQVKKFEAALKEVGHPHEFHIYPDADHAFANPSGTMYNEAAAKDAWEKTLLFFRNNLLD